MAQYHVLASEGRQRYIYTKTHKNIKEKKILHILVMNILYILYLAGFTLCTYFTMTGLKPVLPKSCYSVYEDFAFMYKYTSIKTYIYIYTRRVKNLRTADMTSSRFYKTLLLPNLASTVHCFYLTVLLLGRRSFY
jgi:hypothetical protein